MTTIKTSLKNGNVLVFHPKMIQSCLTITPPADFDRTDPGLNAIRRLLQVTLEENHKQVLNWDRPVEHQRVQWVPIVENEKLVANLWCDEEGSFAPNATRNFLAEQYFGRFVNGGTLFGTIVVM